MDIKLLILDSDLVVFGVLFILLIGSILSWWLFFYKLIYLKKSIKDSAAFFNKIKKTQDLDQSYEDANSIYFKSSYLANIFSEGYIEIKELLGKNMDESSLENVKRALNSQKDKSLFKLQKYISMLATISSSSPFFGLFGTVWGIMNSFISLSSSVTTSTLNAVAPGIAQALVTTAVGLFVAIPALIFYNYLNNLIEEIDSNSNDFINYFVNLIYREFIQN